MPYWQEDIDKLAVKLADVARKEFAKNTANGYKCLYFEMGDVIGPRPFLTALYATCPTELFP